MMFPNYDRSILSTTASILNYYGSTSGYPTLPELDAHLADQPRHVALIIIDGAGVKPLEGALPETSYLRAHHKATVTSIFPSTTTAATTSYYNGLSAYEHGWLGWQLYFKEFATDVTTFMRTTFYTNKPVDGPQPAVHLMPYETIFDKIKKSDPGAVLRTIYAFDSYCEHGADERIRVSSFAGVCDRIAEISKRDERGYTIAYWGEPDTAMHEHGVGSPEAIAQFELIDAQLKRLSERMEDTLLIVTADHGLINAKPVDIARMPEILDCLIMPPMIEGRAAAFYVKPHRKAAFERRFAEAFGDKFLLLSREDIYRTGIFGRGARHPKFDDFIGDYVACATGDASIAFSVPASERHTLVGVHAGLTEDEMLVPVIMDRKK
ncbi:MAG: alkaline phosphatase family protein [Christensenellales bacterium]|jgi:hypothetical protein